MLNERKILNEIHFGKGVLAQQLHQKAGVHKGLCGIPKVDKFQIIVLSAKQSNVIVFEGPRREQQIYLYHCENHYGIITWNSRKLQWERETSLQYGMQMLFYIALSGNHAESSLATMRFLPQNSRFTGDGCYANHCRPNREGQSVCVKNFTSVKMQQSHGALKKRALRSHVRRKDALELRRVCWPK